MSDNRKKFTVYANCQSRALALTLNENKEFASKYKLTPIQAIQTLKNQDYKKILPIVQNTDLFIHQPIAQTNSRPSELTSAHLAEQIHKNAQRISFPSLYFDGYFPHLKTFNRINSVLNLVHDYFIAYLYATGRDQLETLQIIHRSKLYPKALSEGLLERSLQNLQQREKAENTDIQVTDFIKENYKKEKLFFQFNHPNRTVLNYIAESIMKQIGIDDYRLPKKGPQRLNGIIAPVYKSTYRNLNLEFDEYFRRYKSGDQRLDQTKVIAAFYKEYESLDKKVMIDQIKEAKPFVARLIDRL